MTQSKGLILPHLFRLLGSHHRVGRSHTQHNAPKFYLFFVLVMVYSRILVGESET